MNSTVEELQRQLEEERARNQQLAQQLAAQNNQLRLVVDQSILNGIAVESPVVQSAAPAFDHGIVVSPRSSALARSKSTIYPSHMPSMTESESAFMAHKRQRRAFSQQSPATHAMDRSVSNRSESSMPMPFIQTGPVSALPNAAIDRYYASQDEPANQSLQGSHSQRLPSVQEGTTLLDVGVDPSEFIANMETGLPYFAASFNLSPEHAYFPIPSTCPSMISGTSAAETASPLTRQNSSWGEIAGANMARLTSSQSQIDNYIGSEALSPTNSNGKRPATEQDLIGLGASLPPTAPHQYASSGTTSSSLLSSSSASSHMERSVSNTSACSVSSNLERRAKEARERVLQASKASILPKPQDPSTINHTMLLHKKDHKLPVHKAGYQRPKRPRVFCDQCNEHPDGFRGEHELRRHFSAKHVMKVRKFVCFDPNKRGIQPKVEAVNPLSKCKACVSGKQYGAYYNAAAHLRRTHFKPKTPRGKKGGDEKRGGKGGGDWPSMNELKEWFEEVMVNYDGSDGAESADVADDEDVEDDQADTSVDVADMMGEDIMFNSAYGVDSADPRLLSNSTSMALSNEMSPSSVTLGYSDFSDSSPMSAISGDISFDQEMSAFSATIAPNEIPIFY